jgi:hypothetical protein
MDEWMDAATGHGTWMKQLMSNFAPNSIDKTAIPTKEFACYQILESKQKEQHKKVSCVIFVYPCPSYLHNDLTQVKFWACKIQIEKCRLNI